MKKIAFIILFNLCCLFIFSVSAQTTETITVKGVVKDENNQVMEYATIDAMNLMLGKTKRVIANAKGEFEIKLSVRTHYLITPVFIGYKGTAKRLTTQAENMDIGELEMKVNSQQLNEVVVKPLLEINPSGMTYNITADPDRASATMMNMFEKIPLIHIMPNGKIVVEDEQKTGSSDKCVLFIM